MMNFELPIRGIATGLIIAAPVGPVNVLCIQRTLGKGWRSGLYSGVGAAAADTIYGAIAGFSITLVIDFLLKEQFWIRVLGGFLLIAIGVVYFFRKPIALEEKKKDESTHSDFVSTFLLTLTNPTTVLSFIAVLGGLIFLGAPGLVLGPLILVITVTLVEIWRERPAGQSTPSDRCNVL